MNANGAKAIKKVERELYQECIRQVYIIMGAAAITLKEDWGWGKTRLNHLFEAVIETQKECARSNKVSAISMLEAETGIELKLTVNGKSWREYEFLNGKLHIHNVSTMTNAQWLVMRRHQIEWMSPQIQANLLLGLHRRYGFGQERLWKIIKRICEIENDHRASAELIRKEAYEKTGIDIRQMFLLDKVM